MASTTGVVGYAQRVAAEARLFQREPIPGVAIEARETAGRACWTVTIGHDCDLLASSAYRPPPDRPWRLAVDFPPDFPQRPPIVTFCDPVPRHIHVYSNGFICAEPFFRGWSAGKSTVRGLLLSLLVMLQAAAPHERRPPTTDSWFSVVRQRGSDPRTVMWAFEDDYESALPAPATAVTGTGSATTAAPPAGGSGVATASASVPEAASGAPSPTAGGTGAASAGASSAGGAAPEAPYPLFPWPFTGLLEAVALGAIVGVADFVNDVSHASTAAIAAVKDLLTVPSAGGADEAQAEPGGITAAPASAAASGGAPTPSNDSQHADQLHHQSVCPSQAPGQSPPATPGRDAPPSKSLPPAAAQPPSTDEPALPPPQGSAGGDTLMEQLAAHPLAGVGYALAAGEQQHQQWQQQLNQHDSGGQRNVTKPSQL